METTDIVRRLGVPLTCKLKLLLCFLVLFCCAPVKAGTTTTPATAEPKYVPCNYTGTLEKRGNLLDEIYTSQSNRQIDVVFILDRSKSIKLETFEKMKKFISLLIQYQVSTGAIIVHPEYTRIALFSFGKQIVIETDGVTGLLFDACVFEDKLADIPHDSSDQTRPTDALTRAASIFRTSERRGESKQILWFFSDGDFDNEKKDNGTAVRKQAIKELHEMNVQTFAVGVGRPNEGWLNSAEREENLRSIASEASLYLCVEEWLKIMEGKLNSVDTQAETRVPIYGLPINSKMTECDECREQEKCACEVTTTTYTCYDCSESNKNHPQYEYVCEVVITDPPDEETEWLLYAYIGAAGLALILLIIIVIACCCCRSNCNNGCCCCTERTRRSRPGPPVPPPPLPRRRKRSTDDIDLDIYANTLQPGFVNGGFRPPPQPDPDMYVEPVDPSRDQHAPRQPDPNMNVQPAGQNEPKRALMPPKQRKHSYEDVDVHVAVNEKNMEGWPQHLASLKKDGRLEHLGIIAVRSDHYAFTSGFFLPPREVKELDSIFRQGPGYQSSQIKVAANRYTIDKSELSHLNLHGTRPKIQPGSATTESVRIAKANDYFIIGVSSLENDLQCNNCVTELYHHFANHDGQNSA